MHIAKSILDKDQVIDQYKLDLVARAGGSLYSRARNTFFEIPKPIQSKGIGVDTLPEEIKNSSILTGNNLGMLGNANSLPSQNDVDKFIKENSKFLGLKINEKHKFAQDFLNKNDIESALKVLLS